MADDVLIRGGLYEITIRNALAAADDAVTGDKANLNNMALARGLWFQWEYTVQIDLHTDEVVDDLEEVGQMKDLLAAMLSWTPTQLENPAALSDELNDLLRWGAGSDLANQATSSTLDGVPGTFNWPPLTELSFGTATSPIGTWDDLLLAPSAFVSGFIFRTSDGVHFRSDDTQLIRIEPDEINLNFTAPLVASDADIAKARRELEVAIESKTQRNQEKQAQLQDLTAALQRWFTFTTNVNERKKRDADSIVGNFH